MWNTQEECQIFIFYKSIYINCAARSNLNLFSFVIKNAFKNVNG